MKMNKIDKRSLAILLIICVMAFFIRLAVFLWANERNLIQSFEYETLATNLINGRGFTLELFETTYHAAVAPLFPLLCALVYILFGHNVAYVVILQIGLNVLTCFFVFRIGDRIFSRKAGLLSAALLAVHPGMVVYSSIKLHSLSLTACLFSATIFLILMTYDRQSVKNQSILGVVMGLAILDRPTICLFIPFALFWLCIFIKNRKEQFLLLLRISSIVVIILLPWVTRNYLVFHRFIFIQSNQWGGLWLGNNPNASGGARLPSGKTVVESAPEEFKNKLYSLGELGQVQLFKDSFLSFVRNNPSQFVGLTAKKFMYFWWFSPQSGIRYPKNWLLIYKVFYSAIALFALIGMVRAFSSASSRKFAVLILALFLSISIAHSFYYTDGRHRWGIEPLMLVFASAGMIRSSKPEENI